jgi:hypothetical protein
MFRAITGQEYQRANKALFLLARIEKLLRNPLVPACRIIDKSLRVLSPSSALPSL